MRREKTVYPRMEGPVSFDDLPGWVRRRVARRAVAEMLVDSMMTNGSGNVADRLELKQRAIFQGEEQDYEISLGGWCRDSAIDFVERFLRFVPKEFRSRGS